MTASINRRGFVGLGFGLGASLGISLLATSPSLAAIDNEKLNRLPAPRKGSKKQWAQENLRGGEAFIMPSMLPDFVALDEEGVRRDVRHAIAQGFCSVMPLQLGIDASTYQRLQEIVVDEAKGELYCVGVIRPGTWDSMKDTVRKMEATGISHALMYFDHNLADQNAIFQQMKMIINNTSLGIILYASPKAEIKNLDPTGLPLAAFARLADLDNVVGIKFTQELRPATSYAVAERLGDRLLLGIVDLELMLPLSLKYKMQWTGQWGIDSLQSPQQPWVNNYLALLRTGKHEQAYDLYWQYEPIASFFYDLQADLLSIGGHPWLHIKYMKWLTGGNGGLLANLNESVERVPPLNADGRQQCRKIFAKVGIKTVDLPDEAFIVGNAAYERGVRPKDLPALPQYSV
jgi:4-hydroxy-tetrahydrodipicolinate synthase